MQLSITQLLAKTDLWLYNKGASCFLNLKVFNRCGVQLN